MPVEPQSAETQPTATRPEWPRTLWRLIYVVFCFGIGIFLVFFPWLDYWNNNSVATLAPWIREFWSNSYFRGALSGLGVLNLFISLGEIFRLRRHPADKMKVT